MPESLYRFLVGAAAAGAFEAFKLWDLRSKIPKNEFSHLLSSSVLWTTLLLMLSSAGFVSWAFYEGEADVRAWKLCTAGVSARTLIRDAMTTAGGKRKLTLGGHHSSASIESEPSRWRKLLGELFQ